MTADDQEVRARLEPALAGGGRHEQAARAEVVRPATTVIVSWTAAWSALAALRLRFGEGDIGDLGAPDFSVLERAARDWAAERLEYVMLFGADHDAQVLLRPGSGSLVFCGSNPVGREIRPADGTSP